MSRLLFLSHSGIDTEAAGALKARLLAAPAAREHGLKVWFDKDDLRAGEPWQPQLEEAIANSQAFAVYVGSKGVVNWVEAEVRLALNRAITESDYRFVPILAGSEHSPEALPSFAQQFQGVFEVETKPDQFERLMLAVLGGAEAGTLRLESDPFFGLRAIDETRSHLFFGREKETEELTQLVHRTPLVLVTGDSGSGKSSLVHAGLVPRFRGGTFALLDGARAEDTIWHVVTTRPRNLPFRQLGDAVEKAAEGLGRSLADQGTLADWAASGEIEKVRRGLRCGLPYDRTQVLLVVDQFEELLTITSPKLREAFINLLLDLADPADGHHRVVLTMRHDYANLCNAFPPLKERLDGDHRRGRFLLGRMSDEGLRRIVTEPLRLANANPAEREALADDVLRDVGERPGDLALVEMALTEAWQTRDQHSGDLPRAYAAVGRVEGALAQAAENVRTKVLADDEERAHFDTILLRLVRLGDTGGATRRIATRSEFGARWSLVQKLASKHGKRLILLGGSTDHPTAEIAHEALVTAWPHFQNFLNDVADDKRILDALIPRAQAWAAEKESEMRDKRRATGADLELFAALRHRQPTWLSDDERRYVNDSLEHQKRLIQQEEDRRKRDAKAERDRLETTARAAAEREAAARKITKLTRLGASVAVFLALVAGMIGYIAYENAKTAEKAKNEAIVDRNAAETAKQEAIDAQIVADQAAADAENALREQEISNSKMFAALADAAIERGDTVEALSLALRGLPQTLADISKWPDTPEAGSALFRAAQDHVFHRVLEGHEGGVFAVAFNPDRTRLASGGYDGTVRLWDVASGKETARLEGHDNFVHSVTFSPDGTQLASAGGPSYGDGDTTVRLWDVASGQQTAHLEGHDSAVKSVAFSPDGTRLASAGSNDRSVHVWDVASGQETARLEGHGNEVNSVAFSPDGTQLASGSYDGTVRLWELASGKEIARLEHGANVNSVAFSPDGTQLASGSNDDTVRLWDVASGKETARLEGHGDIVSSVAFSPDGTRLASSGNGADSGVGGDTTVRLWDVASGRETARLEGHWGGVSSVAFSPDGTQLVSGSYDDTVRLWDVAKGKETARLEGHVNVVRSVAFSPDGTRLASSDKSRFFGVFDDGAVRLWDVASGKEAARGNGSAVSVAFSPDGTRLAAAGSSDDTIRLWDVASGEETARLDHGTVVNSVAFSPDGMQLASGSNDVTVRLWDVVSGQETVRLQGHEGGVNSVAFSPDGMQLASGSNDDTVRLWEVVSSQETARLEGHGDAVSSVAFSPDGMQLASGSSDDTVRLWDVASGKETARLEHGTGVNSVAFSPDGMQLASGSNDGTVRLWDVMSGQETARFEGHEGRVFSVAFSPDGTRLASASYDTTVRVWRLPTYRTIAELLAMSASGEEGVVEFLEQGQVRTALDHLTWLRLDPRGRPVAASTFNRVCRVGALDGYATRVLDICADAVAKASADEIATYQDSHGIALALTGDIAGANKAFEASMRWAEESGDYEGMNQHRHDWIEALRKGRNPFIPEVLEQLRAELR